MLTNFNIQSWRIPRMKVVEAELYHSRELGYGGLNSASTHKSSKCEIDVTKRISSS